MARTFKIATAAGTFDYFHKGHEEFLHAAFEVAHTIYIAITSDTFAKATRQIATITPFSNRKESVEAFLRAYGFLQRASIFELHDVYGPTLEPDCPFEAIIVTEKTLYGAKLINTLRKQKGLPELVVVQVPYVKAADGGDLSSSRIREGEIDRRGFPYLQKEWLKRTLQLPDQLRTRLQRPIGILIKGSEEDLGEATGVIKQKIHPRKPKIVTVGDVVAKSFNEQNLPMDIAIVDFRVKREEKFTNVKDLGFQKDKPNIIVENPKGTLTGKLFQAVQKALRHLGGGPPAGRAGRMDSPEVEGLIKTPYIIRVIGEEDLATLAVILAAPLDTHVFYGQPNEGIVQVIITEDKKAEVREIVSRFTH